MYNILIFIIGFISSQKIVVFGEINIGELFFGMALLFKIKELHIPKNSNNLLLLLLLWFMSQFMADLVNQTEIVKALKGMLAPIFILITLVGLTTFFYDKFEKLPIFLFGVFVGMWFRVMMSSQFYAGIPWKWGVGPAVALCFFTWLEFYNVRNKKMYLSLGTAIFVLISLANSSRSLAIFVLAASVLCAFSERIQGMVFYKRLNTSVSGRIYFLMILFLCLFAIDRAAAALFSFGPFLDMLPLEDAYKYSRQAESKWGVIVGGRTELLVSIEAFLDSPLFGHGSWAENSLYTYRHLDMKDASGGMLIDFFTAENNVKSYLIPTHSYLMGALVWGGFFAGLFWLKLLGIFVGGFLKNKVLSSPLLVYITIWMIWNILFSPLGSDARWITSVLLWVYMIMQPVNNNEKGLLIK